MPCLDFNIYAHKITNQAHPVHLVVFVTNENKQVTLSISGPTRTHEEFLKRVGDAALSLHGLCQDLLGEKHD